MIDLSESFEVFCDKNKGDDGVGCKKTCPFHSLPDKCYDAYNSLVHLNKHNFDFSQLLDKKVDCQALPAPKFTSISKREYFELQTRMLERYCQREEIPDCGRAAAAKNEVDRLLAHNQIKIED